MTVLSSDLESNCSVNPARESLISARENREMFDAISRRYDLMNTILSLGLDRVWRRRTIDLLKPRAGEVYLDVGSGTGDLELEILTRTRDTTIIALDPAERMLQLGRRKLHAAGVSDRAPAVAGDALSLPFPAGTFHGVVSAFCLRNVEDRQHFFVEMNRVLRDDGRAVVAELSTPANPVMRCLHHVYSRIWVPLLGRTLSRGRAYRYLVDSICAFPSADAVIESMVHAGFAEARAISLHGGIVTVFVGRRSASGCPQGSVSSHGRDTMSPTDPRVTSKE